MKTVPMLFQTDLVRALLDGRKTVTRRPLEITPGWELKDRKPTKITSSHPKKGKWGALIRKGTFDDKYQHDLVTAPCFVDDLIYVRETFAALSHNDYQQVNPRNISEIHEYRYKASERESIANCQDHEVRGYKWVPSIHMPRHASRLTLKVTDVRIETMKELRQDPEQVIREGFGSFPQFRHTWREIYGQCEPDDLVWVIEFEVIHQNIDTYLKQVK